MGLDPGFAVLVNKGGTIEGYMKYMKYKFWKNHLCVFG